MTDPPYTFNLWTEPWIRVTRRDGSGTELGIGACLAGAHELVGLHDPSPLVAAGTHRLLTAIIQAIYGPQDLGEIATVLRSGQFDPAKLDAFAAQHAARFDLFHPTAPFLQTGDVPLDGWRKPEKGLKHDWADPKPIAALFVEVPAETNRTHFHHVTDEGHHLCPACCVRGLVTIPSFASSGGAGIRPSINGVPPVYVLPVGDNLFESLALSLTAQGYRPPTADPERANLAVWNSLITVGKGVQSSFDSHFRPERDRGGRNEKLARFKTIRARMTADYWRRLAPLFRQFIFDLADETTREAIELAWADTLVREGRRTFTDAADQVGDRADALRARVEA